MDIRVSSASHAVIPVNGINRNGLYFHKQVMSFRPGIFPFNKLKIL
jgi:hypothetical protein